MAPILEGEQRLARGPRRMRGQAVEIHDGGHAVGVEMPFVHHELGAMDQLGIDAADAGLVAMRAESLNARPH